MLYDLVIVGMGSAGCMAGSILQHFEKKVVALDAMGYIGGRVNTVPLGRGVVEMGAEWIHGTQNNTVYNYAASKNLDLKHQGLVHKVFASDGFEGNADMLQELLQFAFKVVEEPPESAEPLGHYITRKIRQYVRVTFPILEEDPFVEKFLRWMNLIIGSHESCSNWNDVSTQTKYKELSGSLHMSWHLHGYKTLFDIVLSHMKPGPEGVEVRLNTEVARIKMPIDSEDPVEVICKDGTVINTRAVLVTVSLGVLKERHSSLFSPALPARKIKAIEDLSIGVVNKIILLFEKIWWPTDGTSCFAFLWRRHDLVAVPEADKWITMIFGASLSMANKKCLVFWTSGHEAKLLESLPDDVVKPKIMWLLRKFMGMKYLIPDPVEMIRSTWYSNPFTRGSYSFDNVRTPLHPNARKDLTEPLFDESGNIRILFAGEATSETHFSTVHGALDSGRREATRFLATDFAKMPGKSQSTKSDDYPNCPGGHDASSWKRCPMIQGTF